MAEKQKPLDMKYKNFLDDLRDSGATNMWGAAPYLTRKFGLTDKDAGEILVQWIKEF